MGYHPSYLAMFLKSDDFLMHGNGPLPLHVRNYIAILVSLSGWVGHTFCKLYNIIGAV